MILLCVLVQVASHWQAAGASHRAVPYLFRASEIDWHSYNFVEAAEVERRENGEEKGKECEEKRRARDREKKKGDKKGEEGKGEEDSKKRRSEGNPIRGSGRNRQGTKREELISETEKTKKKRKEEEGKEEKRNRRKKNADGRRKEERRDEKENAISDLNAFLDDSEGSQRSREAELLIGIGFDSSSRSDGSVSLLCGDHLGSRRSKR